MTEEEKKEFERLKDIEKRYKRLLQMLSKGGR